MDVPRGVYEFAVGGTVLTVQFFPASRAALRQCELHGGTALIYAVKARFHELAAFILAVTGGRGIDLVDKNGTCGSWCLQMMLLEP